MSSEKEAHVQRMAERDPDISRLVTEGYEFVTNAFQPGRTPQGLDVPDVNEAIRNLERSGYVAVVARAYDEQGNLRQEMASVWRKKKSP